MLDAGEVHFHRGSSTPIMNEVHFVGDYDAHLIEKVSFVSHQGVKLLTGRHDDIRLIQ